MKINDVRIGQNYHASISRGYQRAFSYDKNFNRLVKVVDIHVHSTFNSLGYVERKDVRQGGVHVLVQILTDDGQPEEGRNGPRYALVAARGLTTVEEYQAGLAEANERFHEQERQRASAMAKREEDQKKAFDNVAQFLDVDPGKLQYLVDAGVVTINHLVNFNLEENV